MINFPSRFRRLNPWLLDDSAVQESAAALQTYLSGGTAVPGQVVGVRNGTNVPSAVIVNEDLTTTPLGGDAAADHFTRHWLHPRIHNAQENTTFWEPRPIEGNIQRYRVSTFQMS